MLISCGHVTTILICVIIDKSMMVTLFNFSMIWQLRDYDLNFRDIKP